jgi:cell division protein FtsZ
LPLPSLVNRPRYEGQLHVTIIATGFAESYEEQLLSGGAGARRGAAAPPAAAPRQQAAEQAAAQQAPAAGGNGAPFSRPDRASRPYLGRNLW